MGLKRDVDIFLVGVRLNLFCKVSDDLLTASANCDFGNGKHCVSYDFHKDLFPSILSGLPPPLQARFRDALSRAPFMAAAELAIELDIKARIGDVTQVTDESFVPLVIQDVMASRFNPTDSCEDPNEYPPGLFKLRDAFVVRKTDVHE